jgi:hypothetical protein
MLDVGFRKCNILYFVKLKGIFIIPKIRNPKSEIMKNHSYHTDYEWQVQIFGYQYYTLAIYQN